MASIRHFETLSPSEILDSLDLEWTITEKFDGSYFRAGIDENGSYYAQRKNVPPCYKIEDWPEEGWTHVFRSAHMMTNLLLSHLEKEGTVKPGFWIEFELIYGSMPNTIPYILPEKTTAVAIIIDSNNDCKSDFHLVDLSRFSSCCFSLDKIRSIDGKTLEKIKVVDSWRIGFSNSWDSSLSKSRLGKYADRLKILLNDWLRRESKIKDFTILEVLEVNLTRKHPKCGHRNWIDLKESLKNERTELQKVFQSFIMNFKDLVIRLLNSETNSTIGAGSFKEGFVVKRNGKLFKFVDRDFFAEANKFSHIIKYWLVGGRRPFRPCFLTRTKDWPLEKRLERLDVLLKRYEKERWTFHYRLSDGNRVSLISYSHDLHERMLNLFADIRKRLTDGR